MCWGLGADALDRPFHACNVCLNAFATLEKLILDDTGVTDELPSLAPLLASTLEVLSVVCPPDADGNQRVTRAGLASATFATRGCGRPPVYKTRCWEDQGMDY